MYFFSFCRSIFFPTIIAILTVSGIVSCTEYQKPLNHSAAREDVSNDTTTTGFDTTKALEMPADTMVFHDDSTGTFAPVDTTQIQLQKKSYLSSPPTVISRGAILIYCPSKMINGLPSIVNATLTKEELAGAIIEFKKQRQEENSDASAKEIETDTRKETIHLFEEMAVKTEVDPEVFRVSPQETFIAKSFGDKNHLDWEWEIIPLRTTAKSFIHFRFYYADRLADTMEEILDKRISVDVIVDNREFLDKWKTFILGDPKTTTTAILIPLATFPGGFLTGKKNKKSG